MNAQEGIGLVAIGVLAVFVLPLQRLFLGGDILFGYDFLALNEAAPAIGTGVLPFGPSGAAALAYGVIHHFRTRDLLARRKSGAFVEQGCKPID